MEIVYSLDGLRDYLRREGVGAEQLRFDDAGNLADDTGGAPADGGGRRLAAPRRGRGSPPPRAIFLDRFLENAIEVDVDAICDGEDVWIGGIMQHVEEAGIHSGDSACVLPPHSLGGDMLDEIRRATHDIALALNTVGLHQRPVRRPRRRPLRDRGQPARVAHGAVRVEGDRAAAGQARLPGDARREARATLACPTIRAASHVSVKEAVLPFDRFAGADALLGPEMRSTGEVMGVAADFPAAFAKAQAAAGARLPAQRHGVPDRDRLRQGRRSSASRRSCTTSASASSPPAAPRPAISRMGIPVGAAEQAGGGLAARRRLDRARRRRPRDQHADRHRGRARTATRSAAPPSPAASPASRRSPAAWPRPGRSPPAASPARRSSRSRSSTVATDP